ncbi:unnamed protein product [Knipowitschia caucasica]
MILTISYSSAQLVLLSVCFSVFLLLDTDCTEASLYHMKGVCSHKNKFFKPGDTFRRGCDKCYCHEFGAYCITQMKPTSWPNKCHRVRTKCGYRVVYKEKPLSECRAYSWIG